MGNWIHAPVEETRAPSAYEFCIDRTEYNGDSSNQFDRNKCASSGVGEQAISDQGDYEPTVFESPGNDQPQEGE